MNNKFLNNSFTYFHYILYNMLMFLHNFYKYYHIKDIILNYLFHNIHKDISIINQYYQKQNLYFIRMYNNRK